MTEEAKKIEEQKHNELMISLGLTTISNIMNRYSNIEDPVLRHSLVLDKFLLIIDVLSAMTKTHLLRETFPEELKTKFNEVEKQIKDSLLDLQHWVLHPQYNPDHSFGKQILREAKADLNNTVERKK